MGGNSMLYRLSLIVTLTAALAYSSPVLAQNSNMMMSGHHACPSGSKKGGCMMGHHTTMSGGKKGYMGHHTTMSGGKKG
jgi:hypothetical protein